MRILVTGGNGFIGSATVVKLRDMGHKVFVMDIKGAPEFHDITNKNNVIECFRYFKPELVYHFAAQSSVKISTNNPELDALTNIIGTINIIQECKKYNCKLIYSGSGGTVYGSQDVDIPFNEECRAEPESPYGISKHTGELYIKNSGLDYCILRYPNVYGPGQKAGESGVVAIFIDNILNGKRPRIREPEQTRDYVYIDDIVDANIKAQKFYGIINIASGNSISTLDVFNEIAKQLDWCDGYESMDKVAGEICRVSLSNNMAYSLGWYPKTSFKDGVASAIQWAKRQFVTK